MSRLIDADELEKVMTEDWFLDILLTQNGKSDIAKKLTDMIDSVPLAFDTEKVVEQLLNMRLIRVEQCHGDYEIEVMTESNFDDAIDIVKKGGVE